MNILEAAMGEALAGITSGAHILEVQCHHQSDGQGSLEKQCL